MNIIAVNEVFQYADGHLGVHLLDSKVAEFTSVKNVEDALKIIRENKVNLFSSTFRVHDLRIMYSVLYNVVCFSFPFPTSGEATVKTCNSSVGIWSRAPLTATPSESYEQQMAP